MAVTSGIVGGVGSIAGGIMSSNAASDAQSMQWKMFNQMQQNMSPYMQGGAGAFSALGGLVPGMASNIGGANNMLAGLFGLNGGGSAGMQQTLQNMPGYQFALSQGQQGVDRGMAARGLGISGGEAKDIDQYSQGLASQNYNNLVSQLMGFQGQQFGQLANMSSIGENAAAGVGSAGMQAASNAGAAGMYGANALATGINGGLNDMFGKSGGFTGLNWGQVGDFFSDRRLKTDIKRVGETDSGLPLYLYRFKGSQLPQVGVMADEVEKVAPAAVSLHPSGFKQVNYDRVARLPARRPVSQLPAMKRAA